MSLAAKTRTKVLGALRRLGTTCTVTQQSGGTYAADGSLSGQTSTTHSAVECSDLIDESRRYGTVDTTQRIAGTFYLAGSVTFTPKVGDLVTYQARGFHVVACQRFAMQGQTVAWRLDVAEVSGG